MMKEIINQLFMIDNALDTLTLSGYNQCATYVNIVGALRNVREKLLEMESKEKKSEDYGN